MKITEIKIRKTEVSAKLRAVVSVTFDEEFVVHDIKVIDGGDRLFLAMPSRKLPDGTFCDIAHPVSAALRKALERQVTEAVLKAEGKNAQD